MRANAVILIIIGLLLLVGMVTASIPDTVTITSDKSYVFAGSGEQSIITVTVTNQSLGSVVPNAYVNFSITNPALGTLTPTNTTTGIDGKATSTFKINKISGFANIIVSVVYFDAQGSYSHSFNITQKIDHNKAYYVKFQHPYNGTVGSVVPFNISFTDYYGNPIDQIINPLQQHSITLHVNGPTPNDCNFVGYGNDIANQPLDQNGNVSVQVKLSSGAGENAVTMDPFELILPPAPRIITGLSNEVYDMTQLFSPDSPAEVPADGSSKFVITYTLFDRFRNPVGQQDVWVNTTIPGEEQKFKTDNLGQIIITYGPRVIVGQITIIATPVNNITVAKSHLVEFTSTAATTMVLTANPEYMASRDVDPTVTSYITATVTDISGNPVEGENVTFYLIGNPEYPGGPYNTTGLPLPSLTNSYALTDSFGHATVQFIPGSFTTNRNAVNYSASATGIYWVGATWNTTNNKIKVTWKNYPYLSVQTSVNPQTVEVNKTVDVTVSLKADGWALQPSPIDAVLVMDRSGSMDDPMGGHTKLDIAKTAATTFVSQMNQSRDRIGLVSYAGYTSGTGTRVDIAPSYTYNTVNTKINSLNANGATETREALKQSIDLLKAYPNPNPKAIQAIILMTDGNFNWKGSPVAVGTAQDSSYNSYSVNAIETSDFLWYSNLGCSVHNSNCQSTQQNMSLYAQNNHVRIYTIGFSANANSFDPIAISTLTVLANSTGGFYSYAPDAASLNQIYTKIAGDLQNTAGVNTAMVTDFSNVNVTGVSVPGAQVFDYVYNSSPTTGSTRITWQDGVTNVTDQTNDWAAHKMLNFTIGTMKVGQTWQATFRLNVTKSGSIDIFGTNSVLLFNNGSEILSIPRTFLNAVPNLNATGFELQQIDVVGSCSVNDPNKAILPVSWITTYTGGPAEIFDEVNYIDDTGARTTFFRGNYHVDTSTVTSRSTTFDMKTVPQGHFYDIEVRTYTTNAQDTKQACGGAIYNTTGRLFIKLT